MANYLNEAPSDFYSTVSSIMREIWYIDLTLEKDALLTLVYRLHGIKCEYLNNSVHYLYTFFIYISTLELFL